jgi:hypothetical protein
MGSILTRLPLLILLALAAPALAVDGVLEINQTCAVQTGCFVGDVAGFPVTLATIGAYALTGNLTVADPDTTAIEIQVPGISLDLRGHAIAGPVSCSGNPPTCTAGFRSGNGIVGGSTGLIGEVSVKNGVIRGMGGHAIWLGEYSRVADVRVVQNGWDGIRLGDAGLIVDSVSSSNASNGIGAGTGTTVSRCTINNNGAAGVDIASGQVSDTVVTRSRNWGIRVQSGAVVANSVSSLNGDEGIRISRGSVSGSTAYSNGADGIKLEAGGASATGNVSTSNLGSGIVCTQDCTVVGNSVTDNTGFGIVAPPDPFFVCSEFMGYAQNVVNDNAGGTIDNPACSRQLGTNMCANTTTCP